MPKITDESGGLGKQSWYGSAFFITTGSAQSAWGKAYKYFDLKWTFLLSICIFEIGSLVCGVAPNADTLIFGRALAGIGCAGLSTGGYTIIAFIAPPAKRPLYTGFVGSSFGVASVLGPLLGGVFTDQISWRWCFYINLPVGAISVLIILFFFQTPPSAKPLNARWQEKIVQIDPLGMVLMLGALLCFGLTLQDGGQAQPRDSSQVNGPLVGFVAIIAVFAAWEYHLRGRVMLDFRLLKQRTVGVRSLFAFFLCGSYFLVIYYLPIYFQSIDGVSPILSGVYNLPLIIASTAAALFAGFFISKTGLAVPVEVVGANLAVVGAGLLYTLDIGTDAGKWIGYQILGAVGWGAVFQVPIMVAQGTAPSEDPSSVTSIVLFFLNLGGSFFLLAAQTIFVNCILVTSPPDIDASKLIATGATQIRSIFPSGQVPTILVAHMQGLSAVCALGIGGSGISLFIALCNGWRKLGPEQVKNATVG